MAGVWLYTIALLFVWIFENNEDKIIKKIRKAFSFFLVGGNELGK